VFNKLMMMMMMMMNDDDEGGDHAVLSLAALPSTN